jgi:hypothetical protein
VETHPEVSLARALVRALRRTGLPAEGVALAERVPVREGEGALAAFCAWLVHLEGALALGDAGDVAGAEARMAEARTGIRRVHEGAARHHAELLSESGEGLERAIDRVWY